MTVQHMSPAGRAELARLEGVVLHVYRDAAGLPTIGVGHLLTAAEFGLPPLPPGATPAERHAQADAIETAARARWPSGLSPTQVDDLLSRDLAKFEGGVFMALQVPVTQPQFDALTMFAFNVGTGAFARSNVARAVNGGRLDLVPGCLAQWNKIRDPATGALVVSPGLVKRRAAEAAWWQRGTAPATGGAVV